MLNLHKKCRICLKKFHIKNGVSKAQWTRSKWCSRECFASSIVGRKLTSEHKKKISDSSIGRIQSQDTRKKISEKNYGKVRTQETITKLRISHLGIPSPMKGVSRLNKRGERHHNWKGGVSGLKKTLRNQVEWKNWRTAVFARDNFTCRECGVRGVYLEPHHIIPLRVDMDIKFNINNGITLCRPCHVKTIGKESNFAFKYSSIVAAQM